MTKLMFAVSLTATTIGLAIGYAVGRMERPRAHTVCPVCLGPMRDHGEQ